MDPLVECFGLGWFAVVVVVGAGFAVAELYNMVPIFQDVTTSCRKDSCLKCAIL
jgi:hypothetical protein